MHSEGVSDIPCRTARKDGGRTVLSRLRDVLVRCHRRVDPAAGTARVEAVRDVDDALGLERVARVKEADVERTERLGVVRTVGGLRDVVSTLLSQSRRAIDTWRDRKKRGRTEPSNANENDSLKPTVAPSGDGSTSLPEKLGVDAASRRARGAPATSEAEVRKVARAARANFMADVDVGRVGEMRRESVVVAMSVMGERKEREREATTAFELLAVPTQPLRTAAPRRTRSAASGNYTQLVEPRQAS